ISDGGLDLSINLIWADQWLGHPLLVSILCLGWVSNVNWRAQSATARWRARYRRRSAGPECSARRPCRGRQPRSPHPPAPRTRPPLNPRQRLLHAIDIGEEVGLDELEEIALQELANPLEGRASCIEHEDVKPPVPCADLLEHGRDGVLLADIGLDGYRGGPTFH